MKHPATMLTALTLTLAGSAAPAADAPVPLTCSTVALRAQVVPGEWLILRHVLRNTTTSKVTVVGDDQWGFAFRLRTRAVGGEWQMSAFWPPEGIPSGDPPFASFQPGEEIQALHVMESSLSQTGGRYEVQRVLRYSLWPDFTKPPAGAWAGFLECTPAQVEVVAPTGVDAQAFEALGPFPLGGGNYQRLLEEYPSSIYTGYVFLHSLSFDSTAMTILHRRDWHRATPLPTAPGAAAERKHRAELDDRLASQMLSSVQTFLGAHPDFPLRSRLRLKQAGLLAYFERYEEAKAFAKKALAEEEDPVWQEEGRRFLDLLVKKGYLKPE